VTVELVQGGGRPPSSAFLASGSAPQHHTNTYGPPHEWPYHNFLEGALDANGNFVGWATFHVVSANKSTKAIVGYFKDSFQSARLTISACALNDCPRFDHDRAGFRLEHDALDLPVAEDYPGHPHSPYGASKRGTEEYLHAYAALYGLRWTSLALANVYGPRQTTSGEGGVVATLIGRMLAGEPCTITGDGEQTRDLVFVDTTSVYLDRDGESALARISHGRKCIGPENLG
jgi:hypothetical protein